MLKVVNAKLYQKKLDKAKLYLKRLETLCYAMRKDRKWFEIKDIRESESTSSQANTPCMHI